MKELLKKLNASFTSCKWNDSHRAGPLSVCDTVGSGATLPNLAQSALPPRVCFTLCAPETVHQAGLVIERDSGQPVKRSGLHSWLVWCSGLPTFLWALGSQGTTTHLSCSGSVGLDLWSCPGWKARCLWAHWPALLSVELTRLTGGWALAFGEESWAQGGKEWTGKATVSGDLPLFISPGHLLITVRSLGWSG